MGSVPTAVPGERDENSDGVSACLVAGRGGTRHAGGWRRARRDQLGFDRLQLVGDRALQLVHGDRRSGCLTAAPQSRRVAIPGRWRARGAAGPLGRARHLHVPARQPADRCPVARLAERLGMGSRFRASLHAPAPAVPGWPPPVPPVASACLAGLVVHRLPGLGAAFTLTCALAGAAAQGLGAQVVSDVLGAVGVLGVPVGAAIAVLRFRLFDIDVVISKAIVYGSLAVFISIVYAGLVAGVGQLAGSIGTPALSAVAAAIVALAFQPVRRRVQRFANRLVYGERATPYEVLSDFSGRVAAAYSTDDILPRMAQIVAAGIGAPRAEVWLRVGAELRSVARWPQDSAASPSPVPMPSDDLPEFGEGDAAFPVVHQGDMLGAIVVQAPASDPITADKEKLIANLAAQAGLVLRNVRLLEDVRASRQRIVTAQDAAARRLERNIHDGAQQQLVALAVKTSLADSLVGHDDAEAHEMLSQIRAEIQEALKDLRDLARGIYPPLLADLGLVAALQAQARKSALSAVVEGDGLSRYPQEAETAVYFCTLEALQNVAKYARASRAIVRLSASDGALAFSIEDDGVGFDPSAKGYGTGIQGMSDRLAALGGELRVTSTPGTGTLVEGSVPVNGLSSPAAH